MNLTTGQKMMAIFLEYENLSFFFNEQVLQLTICIFSDPATK